MLPNRLEEKKDINQVQAIFQLSAVHKTKENITKKTVKSSDSREWRCKCESHHTEHRGIKIQRVLWVVFSHLTTGLSVNRYGFCRNSSRCGPSRPSGSSGIISMSPTKENISSLQNSHGLNRANVQPSPIFFKSQNLAHALWDTSRFKAQQICCVCILNHTPGLSQEYHLQTGLMIFGHSCQFCFQPQK